MANKNTITEMQSHVCEILLTNVSVCCAEFMRNRQKTEMLN